MYCIPFPLAIVPSANNNTVIQFCCTRSLPRKWQRRCATNTIDTNDFDWSEMFCCLICQITTWMDLFYLKCLLLMQWNYCLTCEYFSCRFLHSYLLWPSIHHSILNGRSNRLHIGYMIDRSSFYQSFF